MARHVTASLILLALAAGCSVPDSTGPGAAIELPSPRLDVTTAASVSVVLDGLDSPRGLGFGPEGALYVVEAGNNTITGPCTPVFRGQACYSGTAAVTRLFKGQRERVVSGLPSFYNPVTQESGGANDIDFLGRGNAAVVIGWGADPDARAGLGSLGADFGTLIQLTSSGQWKRVADIAAVERALNPGGGDFDSNPYGLLKEPGRWYVPDAGGNSLIAVDASGATRVVTTFAPSPAPPPFNSAEAVPTAVQRGPDGALYVSKLGGAPFLPGSAAILRVVEGQAPTTYVGGFKMIIDFTFTSDGGLYVLEYDTRSGPFFGGPGRLPYVAPDGVRTVITTALIRPTGVAIGPDGAIYVSNNNNVPGAGQVLRIVP